MECRICYDDTPPFLENACGCRGSQQYIHKSCLQSWLRYKPSGECEICKQPFAIPEFRRPWFYTLLFSEEWTQNTNMIIGCLFFFTSHLLTFQRFLFVLYTVSYCPLILTIYQYPTYFLQWCKPILILSSGRILFPLPTFLLYLLPTWLPLLLSVRIFQRIWECHVGIVGYLGE